jgi:hypothetical protein
LIDDDFTDFCDLFLACIILQKQIEIIDGKKENIIIPSIKMNKIREEAEAGNNTEFVYNRLLILIIL